eukprot:UC4_evm1s1114
MDTSPESDSFSGFTRACRAKFDLLADNDGFVSASELASLVAVAYGLNPIHDQHDEILSTFSTGTYSKTSLVSWDEYLNIVLSARKQRLKAVFDQYDLDGDGTLSFAELYTVLRITTGYSSPPLSDSAVASIVSTIFENVDSNDNGVISFEEFCCFVDRTEFSSTHQVKIDDSDSEPCSLPPCSITCSPSPAIFANTEPNNKDHIHLQFQNTGNCLKSFTIFGPDDESFRLIVNGRKDKMTWNFCIAPGVHVSADLYFRAPKETLNTIHDKIIVYVDNEIPAELPLIFNPPVPCLTLSGSLDFGQVANSGKVHKRSLRIDNSGKRTASFKFNTPQDDAISIKPCSGVVTSDNFIEIQVEFDSAVAPRLIREQIDVFVEGSTSSHDPLCVDFYADVVDQQLELLSDDNSGATVLAFDAGSIFFGNCKTMCCRLFNNGPMRTDFVFLYEEDSCLHVSPMQGTLDPFGETQIVVSFKPFPSSKDSNSTRRFKSKVGVSGLQIAKKFNFEVRGVGIEPK